MKKYPIGGVLVALLIIIVAFIASGSNSEKTDKIVSVSSSKVIVVEEPYDFGDIEIFAGKFSTTYTLRNEGEQDVVITKAGTSCMCTEGEIAGLVFGMHGGDVIWRGRNCDSYLRSSCSWAKWCGSGDSNVVYRN